MTTKGQEQETPRRRSNGGGEPETLVRFNPATGQVFGEIPATPPADVEHIVDHARKVAPEWANLPVEARARYLKAVRHEIYRRLDDVIETIHLETGKPRAEALGDDVLPVMLDLMYYERVAPKALRPRQPARLAAAVVFGMGSTVERRPFGVVGAISPWNYPFSLGLAGIIPALVAGNTVVLKPSEITPGVGERLREVLDVFPPGVANVIQGGAEVGAALVDAPCDKLCFIGSPATGRKIAEAAAKHLTPVVMELGGMDPAIVLEDADLDIASSGVLFGSFVNAGQTCAASERVYVVDEVADEFTERLVGKLAQLRQDPDNGDIGPMAMKRQFEIVARHVEDAVAKGARLLHGGPDAGRRNESGSLWYAPTVIEGVTQEMDVQKEETFGPVLPIIRVRDEEDAIRKANEEGFNLTASVYARDQERAQRVGRALRAGAVGINEVGTSSFGASWAPWGGVGESGYGRIKGIEGLHEFTYPVHFARAVGPSMKRFYWFPYGPKTQEQFRAAAEFLGAPDLRGKVAALARTVASFAGATKEKL